MSWGGSTRSLATGHAIGSKYDKANEDMGFIPAPCPRMEGAPLQLWHWVLNFWEAGIPHVSNTAGRAVDLPETFFWRFPGWLAGSGTLGDGSSPPTPGLS